MKKLISLLLMITLLASCTVIMSACTDPNEGETGDTEAPGGEENPGSGETPDNNQTPDDGNTPGDNNPDDNNNSGDNNGSGDNNNTGDDNNSGGDDNTDPPTSPEYKLIGITLNVDEFAQQSSKLSLKLEAKTEAVVYVILSENTSSFGLLVNMYPGSEQITYELADLTYNETLAAYVAAITVPEMSPGSTFEANLVVNGSVINERFRISVPKVVYVDPNGSNPV